MNLQQAIFEDQIADQILCEKYESVDRLKSIRSSLVGYSPKEISTIMNFLCRDENFQSIVGSNPANIDKLLDQHESSEREIAGSIVTLLLAGLQGWKIWHWVDTKTATGLMDWISHHHECPYETFERRARVPRYEDFIKMQENITKVLPILAKLMDGKSVSDNDLSKACNDLGYRVDVSRFDNYSGHLGALVIAVIKGAGLFVVGWFVACFVSIISLGILAAPAGFIAGVWAAIKTGTAYKRAYEELQSYTTLIERGWNVHNAKQAFAEFKKHYLAIDGFATRLDKLDGGTIMFNAHPNHSELFADLLLTNIKLEARVLGTIVAVSENILSADFGQD